MKKLFNLRHGLLALALVSFSLGLMGMAASCKNDSDSESVPLELARGYSEDTENKTITFLLNKKLWNVESGLENVYVRGSFNSWANVDKFKMTETEENYECTVQFEDLTALGNSGHPEFKFNTLGNDDGYLNNFDKKFIPEPYCFHTSDNNLIIIYTGEDIEDIKRCSQTASIWKALSDWDLDDPAEVRKFANFRKVPGTTNLYRSWHPYKCKTHKSNVFKTAENTKGYFIRATEPVRHQKVIGLYEANGIKTDICLSEDETSNLQTWDVGTDVAKNDNVQDSGTDYTESIPAYYQAMLDAGNVLHMTFTNSENEEEVMQYKYIYQADYNEKYLNDALQCIIDFIKEGHSAPYGIHCRLGNDRTGYYCAVISGLCGASWAEIAEDYQKSNYTYLGEYRDQRLLKQVFEKQFNITDITNYTGTELKAAMYSYYTKNSELQVSEADLNALVAAFTATE